MLMSNREAMLAAKRFANLYPVHTTNFIPEIQGDECKGCGKCVNICPVQAMSLVSANAPHKSKLRLAKLSHELCPWMRIMCSGLPGKSN